MVKMRSDRDDDDDDDDDDDEEEEGRLTIIQTLWDPCLDKVRRVRERERDVGPHKGMP